MELLTPRAGLRQRRPGIYRSIQFGQLIPIHARPLFDKRRRHLQVELERIGNPAKAKTEGLVLTRRRARQPGRSLRDGKRIPVPLEDREAVWQAGEKRVPLPLLVQVDGMPADLSHAVPCDAAPQRLGQKLPPETDTQEGNAVTNDLPDERVLRRQERIRFFLIHIHGPTQADDGLESVGRWKQGTLMKRHNLERDPLFPATLPPEAQPFAIHVLEDQEVHR